MKLIILAGFIGCLLGVTLKECCGQEVPVTAGVRINGRPAVAAEVGTWNPWCLKQRGRRYPTVYVEVTRKGEWRYVRSIVPYTFTCRRGPGRVVLETEIVDLP